MILGMYAMLSVVSNLFSLVNIDLIVRYAQILHFVKNATRKIQSIYINSKELKFLMNIGRLKMQKI